MKSKCLLKEISSTQTRMQNRIELMDYDLGSLRTRMRELERLERNQAYESGKDKEYLRKKTFDLNCGLAVNFIVNLTTLLIVVHMATNG